jgi:lycopene cyclase domain-containing protein
MTYLDFLLVFLVAPIAIILVAWRRAARWWPWTTMAALAGVALLYTTPWDNAIIANGVWSYPPGRVLGPAIGRVPLEECAFYILQVVLTGAVTVLFLTRHQRGAQRPRPSSPPSPAPARRLHQRRGPG